MKNPETLADSQFDRSITERERAIFEGAITLGALYHQFTGIPIIRDAKLLRLLERAMEQSLSVQPYKERVKVRIRDSAVIGKRTHPYDYTSLEGRMIDALVVSKYKGCRAHLRLKYLPELKYSLMYVERIDSEEASHSKRSRRGR